MMNAIQTISRPLDALKRGLGSPNRLRMARWAAQVNRIVRTPPGCDDGFAAEQIEQYGRADFSTFSTWAIVCEEVLDTAFPQAYFDGARAELRRRGISDAEYDELRRFSWLTVGWLNFEKMQWDWCSLDEDDVLLAIELQFKEGWISREARDRQLAFVARFAANEPPRRTI